ncbi:MAG: NAD(P)-binding protein [Campylobacterales bacterium]|nr:NAD(P)-binding protein [Campylobacterales bacterium]
MFEYAVVGSGVGGAASAALLNAKGKNVILFEKEPYLGGCSSTFTHRGYAYNTGATTLAGYQENFIVKEVFDTIGFTPELIETDPTIVVLQNGKVTPRYKDLNAFLELVQKNYPHTKNREFWELVYRINEDFYKRYGHFYSNRNFFKKLCSLASFIPLGVSFAPYLFQNAQSFIEKFFGVMDEEYRQFLESQVLIVAQAPLREINFLTAALSLGYTFNENHYVVGGMSHLFDTMTCGIKNLKRESEILSIKRDEKHFELQTKEGVFYAEKLILNSTVYESAKLFQNRDIQSYYNSYEHLNNYQSSFMLYMTIRSKKEFEHHYQIIQDERFTHTLSNALFVSFSDKKDKVLAPEGHYSITASIHTDLRWWQDKVLYKTQKKELQELLLDTIINHLGIEKDEIVQTFSATPRTFQRYINRSQLGGNAITMKNFLPKLPSNDTPIEGLYNVGDSVYAAQGWPGVMLGVKNLMRLLDV